MSDAYDRIQIDITSDASESTKSIDNLAKSLGRLEQAGDPSKKLGLTADGIRGLSESLKTLDSVKSLDGVISNLSKLNKE